MTEAVITDELLAGVSGSLARRIVDELVYVVDDVSSDENESTEVTTINTADCYRRTVHLVVRQVLSRYTIAAHIDY